MTGQAQNKTWTCCPLARRSAEIGNARTLHSPGCFNDPEQQADKTLNCPHCEVASPVGVSELIEQRCIGHGEGQEHTIADVNAGRIDDLIAPRLAPLLARVQELEASNAFLNEAVKGACEDRDYFSNKLDAAEAKVAEYKMVAEAAEQAEMEYHKDCVVAEAKVAALEREAGEQTEMIGALRGDKQAALTFNIELQDIINGHLDTIRKLERELAEVDALLESRSMEIVKVTEDNIRLEREVAELKGAPKIATREDVKDVYGEGVQVGIDLGKKMCAPCTEPPLPDCQFKRG